MIIIARSNSMVLNSCVMKSRGRARQSPTSLCSPLSEYFHSPPRGPVKWKRAPLPKHGFGETERPAAPKRQRRVGAPLPALRRGARRPRLPLHLPSLRGDVLLRPHEQARARPPSERFRESLRGPSYRVPVIPCGMMVRLLILHHGRSTASPGRSHSGRERINICHPFSQR